MQGTLSGIMGLDFSQGALEGKKLIIKTASLLVIKVPALSMVATTLNWTDLSTKIASFKLSCMFDFVILIESEGTESPDY